MLTLNSLRVGTLIIAMALSGSAAFACIDDLANQPNQPNEQQNEGFGTTSTGHG